VTLAIGILAAVQVFAQVGSRTLTGTITSPDDSGITTAHASIKSIANGDTKSVNTTRDGSYVISDLQPGTYEITA